MNNKKILTSIVALFLTFTLAACAGGNEETAPDEETAQEEATPNDNAHTETEPDNGDHSEADHSGMEHSSSGEIPEGLKEAENPTFEVGSKAIITDGHMEGMKGAEATIVGAYDTVAYAISYTPTNGGERVTNHKWIIHEEITDVGEEPLEPGTEVTVDASHMEGMEGATAEIDSAEQTTVFMIDYTPTTGGEEVKNHKWVTESELSPS